MEKKTVDYAWFVGATTGDPGAAWKDFADEYITAGVWINGRTEDIVNTVRVGDRIVLKSTSTCISLPFVRFAVLPGIRRQGNQKLLSFPL